MTLVHDALVYESDARFIEVLAPFAAEGIARGEQVWVVARPSNQELLRDALGSEAEHVRFSDASEWYQSPARTLAEHHRTIRSASAAGVPGLRVVGEVEFGETEAQHNAWTRYESILNAAFAADPAWIVCPYDARRWPAAVIESAQRTHAHHVAPAQRIHNESFVDPETFVSPLPLEMRGEPLCDLQFGLDLRQVRRGVRQLAVDHGLGAERAEDVVLVVNELATNAVVHGRPPARLRACGDHDVIMFEVSDGGHGAMDTLAGFRPPSRNGQAARSGAGLWIARQLTDNLEIMRDADRTTVRFSIALPGSTRA